MRDEKPRIAKGKRALVVHGHFCDIGGAELFCFRIIAILQRCFDEVVVLHAYDAPSLDEIEQRTGVRLDPHRVQFISVKMPSIINAIAGQPSSRFLVQYAFVVRAARRLAEEFDFVTSTFAECPIRRERMVQNIHFPLFVSDKASLACCGLEFGAARRAFHAAYIFIVRLMLEGSRKLISEQVTITNSKWTAAQFRRVYPGANVEAYYQGVEVGLFEGAAGWVPFDSRENNFVIIGRIVPQKRIEIAIEIIDGLRILGHNVGLRIIGTGPADYLASLKHFAADRSWITFHLELDRSLLEALVAGQKWGIHCYRFEHYGLAPGELQALGCITFIHDSGGQREIISNPVQRYCDVKDAVAKINKVLCDRELQSELLAEAKRSIGVHSGAAFERQFAKLVEKVMSN